MAIPEQQLLGARAGLCERRFEPLGDGGAQFALVPGMALGECFEIGREHRRVDQFTRGARRSLNVQHYG